MTEITGLLMHLLVASNLSAEFLHELNRLVLGLVGPRAGGPPRISHPAAAGSINRDMIRLPRLVKMP